MCKFGGGPHHRELERDCRAVDCVGGAMMTVNRKRVAASTQRFTSLWATLPSRHMLRCRDGAIEREFEYRSEVVQRQVLRHAQPHGSRGECEDTATEINIESSAAFKQAESFGAEYAVDDLLDLVNSLLSERTLADVPSHFAQVTEDGFDVNGTTALGLLEVSGKFSQPCVCKLCRGNVPPARYRSSGERVNVLAIVLAFDCDFRTYRVVIDSQPLHRGACCTHDFLSYGSQAIERDGSSVESWKHELGFRHQDSSKHETLAALNSYPLAARGAVGAIAVGTVAAGCEFLAFGSMGSHESEDSRTGDFWLNEREGQNGFPFWLAVSVCKWINNQQDSGINTVKRCFTYSKGVGFSLAEGAGVPFQETPFYVWPIRICNVDLVPKNVQSNRHLAQQSVASRVGLVQVLSELPVIASAETFAECVIRDADITAECNDAFSATHAQKGSIANHCAESCGSDDGLMTLVRGCAGRYAGCCDDSIEAFILLNLLLVQPLEVGRRCGECGECFCFCGGLCCVCDGVFGDGAHDCFSSVLFWKPRHSPSCANLIWLRGSDGGDDFGILGLGTGKGGCWSQGRGMLGTPAAGLDELLQVGKLVAPASAQETRGNFALAGIRDDGLLREVEVACCFGGGEKVLHRCTFPCGSVEPGIEWCAL